MLEQEKKEQQAQSPNDTNITPNDLDKKLEELWLIEESVFSFADWKISESDSDSDIDEKYKKWLEKAKTLKEKIALVEWLIVEFRSQFWVNGLFETQKNSKYATEESKNLLVEWKNKVVELIKKYPNYKDWIIQYIQNDFDYINNLVLFYEKDYDKTKNKEIIDTIPKLWQSHYEYTIKSKINDLSQTLLFFEQGNIWWDKWFKYAVDKWIPLYWIADKIKNISNLNFCKNENHWINTLDFTTIDIENLKKIDILSKNPSDYIKLVDFIDTLNLENKNLLLKQIKIKEVYTNIKMELSCINPDLFKEDGKQVLIYLSNIKNKDVNYKLQDFIVKFLSWADKLNYYSNFLNTEVDNLSKYLSTSDRFYLLKILIYFNINLTSESNNSDLISQNKKKIKFIEEENTININKNINDVIQKGDPEELQKYASLNLIKKSEWWVYLPTGQITDENISWLNFDLNKKTQQIRTEPAEKPLVSKEKQKGIKDSFSKMWLNVQVSDDWKLLWNNWEKQFSQKIQNGKIEVWANEELVYTTSLWYKFEFNQDLLWLQKLSDITERFNYLNKIWLGYFGEKFKNMLALIPIYLPNQWLNLSINEKTWDFLSNYELFNIIIPIFQNIWFIEAGQNIDYLLPQEVTDMQMMSRVSKIENWGAFIDGKFDAKLFWELLQSKNKV